MWPGSGQGHAPTVVQTVMNISVASRDDISGLAEEQFLLKKNCAPWSRFAAAVVVLVLPVFVNSYSE